MRLVPKQSLPESRVARAALAILGGVILFWVIPYLILRWSGFLLVVFPDGGDRSQTEAVDVSYRPAPETLAEPAADGPVRNVIFLLADGLGFPQLYAARLSEHGAHGRLLMERFPVTGWQTNPSLEDVYTESAASASSLYTGHKVNTRALSVDAEGRALTTLAESLKRRGYRVGLITDSYLWDASLAAHGSHQIERYQLDQVAAQLAATGFDLLVGAWPEDENIRLPLPGGLDSLVEPLRRSGYAVLESPPDLPALERNTVLLYQPKAIAEGHPALSTLADWAIGELSSDDRPMFLFIETEEPDSGSHNRDFSRMRAGLLELDRAARVAVDFATKRSDTLVLITGDHETGGFAILSGSAERPLALRWATSRHTAAPVPIMAYGAGSRRFAGVLDNTQIANRLKELTTGAGVPPD